MRTPGFILILAVLVATGGIALAAIPGSDGTITACAHKRSGALRLIDTARAKRCRSTERRVVWNQRGPAGSAGAAGTPGAAGAAGPSGSAGPAGGGGGGGGTADVYSKTEADARFLGKTETAQNSLRLGDAPESAWLRGNGDALGDGIDVAAGDSATFVVSDTAAVGRVELTCGDPATTGTARFRAAVGRTVHVVTDDGGATPAFSTLTAGSATPATAATTGDHITYTMQLSAGFARVDVWAMLGPDGAGVCRFFAIVDRRFW